MTSTYKGGSLKRDQLLEGKKKKKGARLVKKHATFMTRRSLDGSNSHHLTGSRDQNDGDVLRHRYGLTAAVGYGSENTTIKMSPST